MPFVAHERAPARLHTNTEKPSAFCCSNSLFILYPKQKITPYHAISVWILIYMCVCTLSSVTLIHISLVHVNSPFDLFIRHKPLWKVHWVSKCVYSIDKANWHLIEITARKCPDHVSCNREVDTNPCLLEFLRTKIKWRKWISSVFNFF